MNSVWAPRRDVSDLGHEVTANSCENGYKTWGHINNREIAWPIYGLSAFKERTYTTTNVTHSY